MTITLLAVFLAGIVVEHAWIKIRKLDRDEELRHARAETDFWHEQCDQWHRIAMRLGAGQRRPKRIIVPEPPQAEIVTAGKVGLKVWRN